MELCLDQESAAMVTPSQIKELLMEIWCSTEVWDTFLWTINSEAFPGLNLQKERQYVVITFSACNLSLPRLKKITFFLWTSFKNERPIINTEEFPNIASCQHSSQSCVPTI
jgi:hypothetical protein